MDEQWWRDAVVYQTYLRSFNDANADGIGDLAGLRQRLSHIRDLGVDALWLNPCYLSPQKDHGYDVADYRSIDPQYGTLVEFDGLVIEAHRMGVRVLMDMVANHCSIEHPWFRAALASAPGSSDRERFLFREGRGPDGELPPNNWESVFGGPAWTRVLETDGSPGQWYLHAFDESQPDFNWRNPEVNTYFREVLRFWFDRGVDGFRIDVAHGMFKANDLPDFDPGIDPHNPAMWNQPEVHDVYRTWRSLGDEYSPPRYYVGEIWVPSTDDLARYIGSDQLHQAFCFDLLVQPWHAAAVKGAVERGIAQGKATGQAPAWTLSNHDVHRTVTRYGQDQDLTPPTPSDMIAAARRRGEVDLALGTRRARAAAMLELALPGTSYLYQGEELGLPEVFDLPDDRRQDPIWRRSGGTELGRDGCRVPFPWRSDATHFGFSASKDGEPWLPQPDWFGRFAAYDQETEAESMLNLYRRLITTRRTLFGPDSELEWLETPAPDVLVFRRGAGICVVNFADTPAELAGPLAEHEVALTSMASATRPTTIPGNCAAWLRVETAQVAPPSSPADRVLQDSPLPQLVPTAS